MSLNATKLFAMAAKLEEEGIIAPNTEVEVSASVSVTPEEQEKIDEALTQVEEIATAENELEEATQELEDLEEAEATLSAIRDTIKRDGIVTPQLYAFLHSSGYLDVISTFQKNVAYPAVEAITPVTVNKQYADSIIAGCEAGLESIHKSYEVAMEGFFDKIKALANDFVTWFTATERKVRALHDTLGTMEKNNDLSDTNYSYFLPSFEQMKEINEVANNLKKDLDKYSSKFKNVFSSDERGNTGFFEQIKKNFTLYSEKLDSINTAIENKPNANTRGRVWTVKEAGFTYDNLNKEAYELTLAACKNLNTLLRLWGEAIVNPLSDVQIAQYKNHPIRTYLFGKISVPYLITRLTGQVRKIVRGYVAATGQAISASKKASKK